MAGKFLAAGVALALVAGGGWWALNRPDTDVTTTPMLGAASAETAVAPLSAEAAAIDPALLADRSMGNPDAPVKMTEYASFTCPHCAAFNETVFKDIKKNYIDTGKVYFTLREVYFDRFGLWAGMIARCGGTDRYFGFVDTFFQTRDTWLNSDDPAAIADNLKRIGKTGGMDDAQIDQCLNNQPFAEALVANFQKNMAADAIEGTPSFIIDGTKYSNMSYEEFAAVLDEKLK